MKSNPNSSAFLFALLFTFLAALPTQAATYWWDTTGNGTWSTGANWSDNYNSGGATGTVPAAGDIAIFNQASIPAAATTAQVDADGSTPLKGLVVNNPTGSFAINSNKVSGNSYDRWLTIGSEGILINGGAAAVTLGSTTPNKDIFVNLASSQSWINNSANQLTINGGVTGNPGTNFTLTLGGTGTTVFAGNTTYYNGGYIYNPTGGTTAVAKIGAGAVTFTVPGTGTGTFTFTGGVTANAGTLLLNSTAIGASGLTNIVANQTLTLGGGLLEATWSNTVASLSNQQSFASLTLNAGASTLDVNHTAGNAVNRNAVVNLGTVARSAGSTLNVALTGTMTTPARLYVSGFTSNSVVTDNGVTYATAYYSNASTYAPNASANDWATSNGSGQVAANAYAPAYSTVAGGGNFTAATNADVTGSPASTNDIALTSLRISGNASSTITINGGQTITTGGILISSAVGANTQTITGGALRSAATVASKDLVIINNGSGYLDLTGTVITNAAAGSTGLTKSGVGGLALAGAANTYDGPTFINGGFISINTDGTGASNPLGAYPGSFTANAISLNGGGLAITGDTTLGANRGVTLGGNGGALYAGNGKTLAIGGAISSAAGTSTANGYGALTIGSAANQGTVILAGNNIFTGGVAIAGGVLQLNDAGALNSTAGSENTVRFTNTGNTTAVLTLNGISTTIADLSGGISSSFVQNASASPATLTVGNSQNLVGGTFAGTLTDGAGGGALSVSKTGNGLLTLSGPNYYTGSTTVIAGTLLLGGGGSLAAGSAVAVNAGAFGGSGTVGGDVTLATGATLQAGTSLADTATLTLNGNVTAGTGTLIAIGLGSGAATHDVLAFNPAATVTLQTNQSFRFIDQGAVPGIAYTSIITGLSPSLNVSSWSVSNSLWVGSFSNNAGNIDFALTAIPEPSTWLLIGLGLAFLHHRKPRRRFEN